MLLFVYSMGSDGVGCQRYLASNLHFFFVKKYNSSGNRAYIIDKFIILEKQIIEQR